MKKINLILTVLFICGSINTNAQVAQDKKYFEKVQTIESTVKALYNSISGEKGETRDWEFFKYLFRPEAKLIPSGPDKQGKTTIRYLSPQEYIDSSGKWLLENGFFEKEISRTVHEFGNIAQVFSTYEAFRSEADEEPAMVGINGYQLIFLENRWWIVNVFWQQASKEQPIPEEFMPSK